MLTKSSKVDTVANSYLQIPQHSSCPGFHEPRFFPPRPCAPQTGKTGTCNILSNCLKWKCWWLKTLQTFMWMLIPNVVWSGLNPVQVIDCPCEPLTTSMWEFRPMAGNSGLSPSQVSTKAGFPGTHSVTWWWSSGWSWWWAIMRKYSGHNPG